jgi:hypothetical protein
MRFLILIAVASALSATALEAQQPAPVTRADTLGANFDWKKEGKGTPNDFDFLVGDWTFRFQNRAGQGWGPVQAGTWKTIKKQDGLLEDVWTLGNGEPTLTWRSFNRAKSVWEFQGLKTSRGSWDPGVAWSNGDERFVVQTFAGQTLARIRYQKVTANHFLWRADVSPDEGKTWLIDQWILEANRAK